jgi:hypothetical protein
MESIEDEINGLFLQPLNGRLATIEYTEVEAIIATGIFKKTKVRFMSRIHQLSYLYI